MIFELMLISVSFNQPFIQKNKSVSIRYKFHYARIADSAAFNVIPYLKVEVKHHL